MSDRIPASAAARLLLDAQGLCADPSRKATKRELAVDWIIDLGTEERVESDLVIAEATPEQVAKSKASAGRI